MINTLNHFMDYFRDSPQSMQLIIVIALVILLVCGVFALIWIMTKPSGYSNEQKNTKDKTKNGSSDKNKVSVWWFALIAVIIGAYCVIVF